MVFELRQGLLLVLFINPLAQEIAKRSLTPSLINDLTFVLGFRHFPAGKEMWLSVKNIETAGREYVRFSGYLKDCLVCPLQKQCMRKVPTKQGRQVQFETGKTTKRISYTDRMRVKIDSSPGRRAICQ